MKWLGSRNERTYSTSVPSSLKLCRSDSRNTVSGVFSNAWAIGPSLSADTSIYPEAACSPACFMVFEMEPSTSPSIRSMTSRSAGMAGRYETSYETGVDRKSLRRAIS